MPRPVDQRSAAPAGADRAGETGETHKAGKSREVGPPVVGGDASNTGEIRVAAWPSRGSQHRCRWHYWATLSAAALVAVICAVALAPVVGPRPGVAAARDGTVSADGTWVVRFLPSTRQIRAGPRFVEINSLADVRGSLWLTAGDAEQNHLLYRVDPVSDRIEARVRLPSRLVINPGDVAAGSGAVWVAVGARLYRIEPVSAWTGGAVTHAFAALPRGGLIGDVAVDAGSVWVTDTTSGKVYRFAADSGRLDAVITVGTTAGDLAVGDGGLWVADADAHTVSRISVADNRVASVVTVPGVPDHLAASDGSLWVTDGTGNVLSVPAGAPGRVLTVRVGGKPTRVAAIGGTVWVANTANGTLSRINARRRSVVATVSIGVRPYAVAADRQGVWVADLGTPAMAHTPVASSQSSTAAWFAQLARLCGVK